jgi:8-oxo-dGTP diphosphatase
MGESTAAACAHTHSVDIQIPGPLAVIYVLRHAHAGTRLETTDDHLRRLSVAGQCQAQVLAAWLGPVAVGDILSSPYVRCIETLEPLAAGRGCPVLLTDALAEGAEIGPLLRLVERLLSGSVLCTHGDILHRLIEGLGPAELDTGEFGCLDKGVIWVLARDGDCLSVVEVIPPPYASTAATDDDADSCFELASARRSSLERSR